MQPAARCKAKGSAPVSTEYHHLGPKTQQMDIKPLVFTKRLGRFGFGYPSNINHTLGHACVCGRNLGSVMFTWI